jgi:hypothetical protein
MIKLPKELIQAIYQILEKFNKIIALSIFILIFTIGSLIFLKPRYDSTKNQIDNMKYQKEAIIKNKQNKLDNLGKLYNEYKNIEEMDRDKINKIIPDENSHSDIFPHLEYIALRNGLFAQKITYSEVESAEHLTITSTDLTGKIGIIKLNIVVTGADYNGFKKFLQDLENDVRLMDVTSLSFSLAGKAINLDIYAYYWKY